MSDPAAGMIAPGVAAAILAGGRGTRMAGQGGGGAVSKGLLVVAGQRIIDRQLSVLRPRFAEVIIAANDPALWAGLGVRVVADRVGVPLGPIAGLEAVLAALPDGVDAVVCVAGDMPFLSPALLEHLRDAAPGAPALVARVAGRPEPLLARYARAVAPVVAEQIAGGRHAVIDLLARLEVTWLDEPALRALDPELRSIANVNTPADLARLDPGARS
ncbi:MAG TPA: molybdenum cofactor guanylyltransferase [Polyangia bacterium]|nr:molybdenum cofactor guanylyltransferase [Polyangia bacterium]